MNRAGFDPAVLFDGALDEFLREGIGPRGPDLLPDDFARKNVDDNVEKVVNAACRAFQLGDVPGPYLVPGGKDP